MRTWMRILKHSLIKTFKCPHAFFLLMFFIIDTTCEAAFSSPCGWAQVALCFCIFHFPQERLMQYPDVQTIRESWKMCSHMKTFIGGWDKMEICPIILKSFNLNQLYNKKNFLHFATKTLRGYSLKTNIFWVKSVYP